MTPAIVSVLAGPVVSIRTEVMGAPKLSTPVPPSIGPVIVKDLLFINVNPPEPLLMNEPSVSTLLAEVRVVPPVDVPVRVPTVIVPGGDCDTVPAALRARTDPGSLPAMGELIWMLPAAFRVRVDAVVQATDALTVIAPVSPLELGEPIVLRITLVLRFSAF